MAVVHTAQVELPRERARLYQRCVEVLLRRQLRPAVLFRRGKVRALPEAEPLLYEELVAGLVEPGEQGLDALRRRGAEEAWEEAVLLLQQRQQQVLQRRILMMTLVRNRQRTMQ